MPTDVSTSMPDVDLPPGCTITVTLDDASADITLLNVWGFSPEKVADDTTTPQGVYPIFAYGPGG